MTGPLRQITKWDVIVSKKSFPANTSKRTTTDLEFEWRFASWPIWVMMWIRHEALESRGLVFNVWCFNVFQVHLKSQFILNGVCVIWKGWLDLHRLDGIGSIEFDVERATVSITYHIYKPLYWLIVSSIQFDKLLAGLYI